jgi:K+-transporting ATPase KdpF subunit
MRKAARNSKTHNPMDVFVVGLISLALLVYLVVAMLWPEKF